MPRLLQKKGFRFEHSVIIAEILTFHLIPISLSVRGNIWFNFLKVVYPLKLWSPFKENPEVLRSLVSRIYGLHQVWKPLLHGLIRAFDGLKQPYQKWIIETGHITGNGRSQNNSVKNRQTWKTTLYKADVVQGNILTLWFDTGQKMLHFHILRVQHFYKRKRNPSTGLPFILQSNTKRQFQDKAQKKCSIFCQKIKRHKTLSFLILSVTCVLWSTST